MEKNIGNTDKITFKRYYDDLEREEKQALIKKITEYVTESHFYWCMRNKKFSKLLRKELETICNKQFNWDE